MTGRGVLPLVKVPDKVKINSEEYVQNVLVPLLEQHLPVLYAGELDKVFVHHDAAPSHTSKRTVEYAAGLKARTGITIIPNEEIPVKSPDTSPLDFYGFGALKQRLQHRHVKTTQGLWKVLNDDWAKVTPETCVKVFSAWKRRLRLVKDKYGQHIENCKQLHSRKVTP